MLDFLQYIDMVGRREGRPSYGLTKGSEKETGQLDTSQTRFS